MGDCQAVQQAILSRELPRGREAADDPALLAHVESCWACAETLGRLALVDRALAALAAERAPPPPPFEHIAGRARAAARGRRRARLMRRTLPMSLAFASAVVATIGVTRFVHRPERGAVAAAGEVLDASRGTVQATLADGARLLLASGRATVEASERLRGAVRLEAGSVFLDVPHLPAGATFALVTDEVEVRDRGTRFDVARLAEGTRISVTDGAVEVRPRDRGQRPFLLEKGETRLVEGGKRVREREEAAQAHAVLAWKLSRGGDRAGAVQSYRRALSLLPRGAETLWADNACAQLALLAECDGATEGALAWRDYLDRFPDGVHAAMARDRLARPTAQDPSKDRTMTGR